MSAFLEKAVQCLDCMSHVRTVVVRGQIEGPSATRDLREKDKYCYHAVNY